ncbi:hypothetical protein B0O99DRAFT_619720 [Bisporella sp. PMI_857]|nr:hypothetical protein B0O99DRAFT_619720 [Bisporella sp. PMI_857]
MSADDATFLDTLASVPNDIRKYSNEVADYVDKHLEKASNTLREVLSTSPWIPESARPRPPPRPRTFVESATPTSTFMRLHGWVMNHKFLTTIIVVSIGGITYYVVKRKSSNRKKRRAKKASNGARQEVVVVAGSPSEPLVRSVSLDLERRGYIVYVVCHTVEDEIIVQSESRQDVKPLMIDIVDPESARASIERFTAFLQTPHAAFAGAKSHHLILRSLVIIPHLTYPTSPIATLAPAILSDLMNTRLLTPILTTQTFLPLLTSLPLMHPHHHAKEPAPKPSVLVLTPSIIPSLNPAFHAPESLLVAAMSSFTSVLRSELSPLNIPVSHLQLGTFDFSSFSPHGRQSQHTFQSQRAETLKWDDVTRATYGRNYVNLSAGLGGIGKGSSLRELNNAIFDTIYAGKARTIKVGMGAGIYGFVGRWVPSGLVGWIMGQRNVEIVQDAGHMFGRLLGNGDETSSDGLGSPLLKNSRPTSPEGLGDSGYVYPERA